MTLANIFRGLCILSGAVVGALAAAAKSTGSRNRPQPPVQPVAERRDYFSITKSRANSAQPKWVLQGFGRFECFLLFDTWRDAMDQASFRIENIFTADLVQLSR